MKKFVGFLMFSIFLILILGTSISYAGSDAKVIIVNPRPGFKVTVSVPKKVYYIGEKIKIYIGSTANCYVAVYDIDTRGVPRLIFPNRFSKSNYLRGGSTYILPDNPNYSLQVGGPQGVEQILVIASKSPTIIPPSLFEKAKTSLFPSVGRKPSDLKNFINKVISVIPNNMWSVGSVTFYVKERPKLATITVNSVPSGASVYLDGILRGQTPITFTTNPGTHTLKLSLSGYVTKITTFTISSGQRRTFNYTLNKVVEYGSLKIDSNPQGAKVYIDNVYRGTSPLSISNIRVGTHEVRLRMSGYKDWVRNVYVTPNRRTDVYASLVPSVVYGDLILSSGVPGSKVFLNGTYKGKIDANGKLEITDVIPGDYELTVIVDGYRTVVQDIYITGGERTYIYLDQITIK